MMYGLDISNWQAGFNLAHASRALDFVILKASEYGWKKDPQFDGFAATAVSNGLRLGTYMFAPMKYDGGKWSSPIFDYLAHFSIVENL